MKDLNDFLKVMFTAELYFNKLWNWITKYVVLKTNMKNNHDHVVD